jgi:hypothetical protein
MSILSSLKPKISAAVGAILLAVPSYFIGASALRQNAPGLSFLGIPVVLLGTLLIAFVLNALSILSITFRRDSAPPVVSISLSLRFSNLVVVGIALALMGTLLGYAFLENFQPRPVG